MKIEYSNHPNREREIPEGCPPEFRARIMEIRSTVAERLEHEAEKKKNLQILLGSPRAGETLRQIARRLGMCFEDLIAKPIRKVAAPTVRKAETLQAMAARQAREIRHHAFKTAYRQVPIADKVTGKIIDWVPLTKEQWEYLCEIRARRNETLEQRLARVGREIAAEQHAIAEKELDRHFGQWSQA